MTDTIILDGPGTPETNRLPGDFRRRKDGAPYVKSLTETRQPKGNKPDLIEQCAARGIPTTGLTVPELRTALGPEPAWELYGRPSGFGDLIENQYNLMKYSERLVALGIAMDPSILRVLDGVDDEAAEREALDRMVNQAHEVAGKNVAAERGTFLHAVTEWADEVEL